MKTRLKNAPYLAEQRKDGAELLILIGSQAWQAWGQGNATEWQLLAQAIQTDPAQKPVILGGAQLAEIDRLQLAEAEDRTAVRLFQFGAFSHVEQLPQIVANLAKNTQVSTLTLCDSLGHLQKDGDLSDWLKRTREQGADSVAELVAQSQKKNAPTIDFADKPTQPETVEAFLNWSTKPIRADSNTGKILEYNGLYWENIPERDLQAKIVSFYKAHGHRKYTASNLKAIADLVAIEAEAIPAQNPDFIGFQNGVVNKKTGEFMPHEIGHFLRAVEKFNCNTDSLETPLFDDWIDFVCNGNQNKRNAILAGLYMVLTNRREWALFLEATGTAGAGKSVFSRIASIINGESNTAYINLQELEDDRKRGMLIGKSLAISPDQKPYKGSADELKAITGGEPISVKLLYVDSFEITLESVFMLVTNYPLLFTDRNGGIARRRIIIPFDRAIPKEKKDVNFTDKLKLEVYGIINKLLATFPQPETARRILEDYQELDEGKSIKRESNHLIDFVTHFELREVSKNGGRKGALRLGSARKNKNTEINGFTLYSAYLYYCECNNITNFLNVPAFKSALPDAFRVAGEKIPFSLETYYGYENTSNAHWKHKELTLKQWEG